MSQRDDIWLRALATNLGVPNESPRPLLPLSSSYVPLSRSEDESQANLLMAQASEIRRTGECKTTSGTSKIKKDKWTYEDYCSVLIEVVGGSGSVGVAESIWNSFQLQKPKKARTGRFSRRQQAATDETDDLLVNLLSTTMRYKTTDMLHFVAHAANPEVINKVFPTAVRMRSLRTIQILLEENADPNTCSEEFIAFVEDGEEEFVRLLLSAQTPLDQATVTAALPAAVRQGNAILVDLLLAQGADAGADNGLAMEHAVSALRTDLVLSLLLSPNPPSPATLAPIVSYVFFKLAVSAEKKYHLIELLLHGGAAGDCVSFALGGAVREQSRKLVQLFIDKGASINYYNGEAYRHAVHQVDLETIRILNGGSLEGDLATDIFGEINKTKLGASISNKDWRDLAEALLYQGAVGYSVDDSLVERVKARDLESVKLLLEFGASVDYKNGRALDNAVVSEQQDFIDCLLETQPAVLSVNSVFCRVEGLSRNMRLSITRKLLHAGANGAVVDVILHSAVSQPCDRRDQDFIRVLVEGGADVSQGQGSLLHSVVQTSDDRTLQILLLGSPSSHILASCIPATMGLAEKQRFNIMQILLQNGARGEEVSEALVDSIDGTDAGHRLASLLLAAGEAKTSFRAGQAFKKAIGSSNIEFLELLVQHNHLNEAEFCSCLLVAIDLPQGDNARLEKIRLFLASGSDISGDTGTTALRHEMQGLKRRGEEATLGVIRLLLDAGANVNHNHGRILLDAIETGLFECFNLFLAAHPSFQSLESSFEKALVHAFRTFDLRYLNKLLAAGVPQTTVDKALLRAAEEDENEKLVVSLLLNGASVNYQDGAPIRKAISRLDLRLLARLLKHSPTSAALENAFALAMTIQDPRARYEVFRLLLEAGKIASRLLDEALVDAAGGGWTMAAICELLLQHHASPNYANGASYRRAIKASDYRIGIIQLLLRSAVPSEEAVAAALECAFEVLQGETRLVTIELLLGSAKPQSTLNQLLLKTVKIQPCDRALIKSLLQANASVVYKDGECILQAVMKSDVETLQLLEPYFTGNDALVSSVFQTAWHSGKRAQSPRDEAVLSVLLSAGAKGEWISAALVETIKSASTLPAGYAFIVNLLKAGADVNYNDGASLVEASTQANLRFLKELLAYNPRRANLTRAFPLVFSSKADSHTVREIAVAFCSHASAPDLTYQHPQYGPLLLQVLRNYPNERELLRYLIEKGCSVDPIVKAVLPLAPGEENVSLLCWALAQEKPRLREDVIAVLVAAGADVNHRTPLSQSTPLQLAILGSRSDSVATLLSSGADPSVESSNGTSALSLASAIGNSDIVRQLLKAGAAPNDGSLHEAARMVNVNVLQVLIKEGKQRDYPCSRFQGRTALAELCLKARGKPVSQIKSAISLLKANGDFRRKSKGKSVLHFALDNEDAITITQALLDVFMSEFINEEFNLYEDGRFRYSPIAYVSKGLNRAPTSQREGLHGVLGEFECRNRIWAVEGEQPEDMVGAPDDIMRLLRERQQRQARIQEEDEDHHRRLAQRRAETAEDLAGIHARHELAIQSQREMASETAKIEEDTALRQATIASSRYDAELAYIRQVTELTNQRKDDQNTREIEHRKNVALLEQGYRDEGRGMEKLKREEELNFVQQREKLLTSGYEDRARIDRERYTEQMRLFEAQKQAAERMQRPTPQIAYEPDSLD